MVNTDTIVILLLPGMTPHSELSHPGLMTQVCSAFKIMNLQHLSLRPQPLICLVYTPHTLHTCLLMLNEPSGLFYQFLSPYETLMNCLFSLGPHDSPISSFKTSLYYLLCPLLFQNIQLTDPQSIAIAPFDCFFCILAAQRNSALCNDLL